ncbi:uncharacterized protein [Sinocyclocheilus grahami]|uniref:uncharacterized protein isoform X2 n=1 Tax=Sinocyclocheilus grahami TaxID=75366 RepID=UPI0007AC5AF7|nr:PREDICTED: uncharacterized protein LOC107574475 isoform X2 [Sinocyclocheilus grahami]
MKSALAVVLFRLCTIGVFIDGKESSNGELVSVTEGDSVTLKSGVTDIQKDDEIEWRFNGTRIAKISSDSSEIWVKPDGSFKDRLLLDNQTGDLKISNIRTTDSGQYKVKISSPGGSPPEMTFTVKVVSADAVKPVSVLEGDSVTLRTDPTYIQRYDVIRWRFDHQNSSIAEIDRTAGIFNTFNSADGRFRDRLQLDNQTGSLNITNINCTDSGLYEADISSTSSRYTLHHTQSFNVTVSDAVKSLSVKEGDSVTLPTITEIQNVDLILWMFGSIGLAEIHKTGQRFYIYDGADGIFISRLKLDNQTGSLIITNTRTTDPEDYVLKIISSRCTITRRITVTVTAVPYSGLPRAAGVWIGVAVGVILVAALVIAAVVMYYRRRNSSELERQSKYHTQFM